MTTPPQHHDVLIVGAGISGIGMAAHMKMLCPGKTFTIVERRDQLGGTWDLFRYPGIRSDSDMHTLGFVFEPWKHEKTIADGPAILDYLNRIVDERGIRSAIRFGHKVVSADFDSDTARWNVTLEDGEGQRTRATADWLYLGSGYYDYDEPYDAGFDFSEFAGDVIHPQFWPEGYDYTGKKVVVIGSGATAVTIVPSMARDAAHVTMLQRTPTWMFSRPAKDRIANFLRKVLPEETAYKITRAKNIFLQSAGFKRAKTQPDKMKKFLKGRIKKSLGEHYDSKTFTPPYDPWDQRLCLVPDDDLFEAMKADRAAIVTGHIDRFEKGGVRLQDGSLLEADIIVTATGLKLAVAGKIDLALDGRPLDLSQHYYYKGCMFSNVPNLAVVFGYLNASWTLRSDINAEYICRVLNAMDAEKADLATPVLSEAGESAIEEDDIFDFSSGYIQRSRDLMPRSAVEYPWRLNQNYREDRKIMQNSPVDDGILTFAKANESATLEAAE